LRFIVDDRDARKARDLVGALEARRRMLVRLGGGLAGRRGDDDK